MVSSAPESTWLVSAFHALSGATNNRDLSEASGQWLAQPDAPLSLLPLVDLPPDATRDEVSPRIAAVLAEVDVAPEREQIAWVLAASAALGLASAGVIATARELRSLTILNSEMATALRDVVVLADDLDDDVPGAWEDAASVLQNARSEIRVELLRVTTGNWAWRVPIAQLVSRLSSPS